MRSDKADAAIWDTPFGKVTLNIASAVINGRESVFQVSFDAIASLRINGETHGRN